MRNIDLVVGDLYVHNNRLLEFTHVGSHHGYWFKRIVDGAGVCLASSDIANVTPHTSATFGPFSNTTVQYASTGGDTAWGDLTFQMPKPKVCECGAHKVGSNAHSSWCALNT